MCSGKDSDSSSSKSGGGGGCSAKLVKYLLFTSNFLIIVLALAVLGFSIWVLVHKPSFMKLFDEASKEYPDVNIDITLYTSAAWILVVVSSLVIIIAFFGCCGAIKMNKCMLGTYFFLILSMFIAMVVGTYLGYTGDLESSIKEPLQKALSKYDPDTDDKKIVAVRRAWDEVQKGLRCCGIDDYKDWEDVFKGKDVNKPKGCCGLKRSGEDITSEENIVTCQKSTETDTYYFNGCYTAIDDTLSKNQDTILGVTIGAIVIMFLNMLFAFALCTMVG